MHKRLLPGEVAVMSKKALAYRSHRQRINRSKQRTVVFSNGITEKRVTVIASTDKKAAHAARKQTGLTKIWKIVRVEKAK